MRVLIVGAGFGGLSAAIELRGHGFDDITILEHATQLGGTWRDNTYPGAACDVPSHLYSFSFAQRRDWTRLCSPQSEILDRTPDGRIVANWPYYMRDYFERTRTFDPSEFELLERAA